MKKRDLFAPHRVKDALKNSGVRLQERQMQALCIYLSGISKEQSLKMAGYESGTRISTFDTPTMRAATKIVLDKFLQTDAAPAALRALYMIVNDDRGAAGVRVQAANSILDRAGLVAKKAGEGDGGLGDPNQDLSSMSADQLQAMIDKLDAALASKTLDVQPDDVQNSVPVTSQDIDLYE